MALRIKRGLDIERQSYTPLQGELLYTTDTAMVYIGDGATPGGILVGPLPSTVTDVLNDTSPQLGGDLDLNGHNITGSGNINIDGVITATGNIGLGNDPSDIVEVGGTINSSLRPSLDGSFDLGSATRYWRELFAYGATIDGQISAESIVADRIVSRDSSVVYNGFTNSLQVNYLEGDVRGSVFANDSTVVVDGNDGTITTDRINSQGELRLNTGAGMLVESDSVNMARYVGTYEGGLPSFTIESVRGSVDTPSVLQPGDLCVNLNFATYYAPQGADIGKSLVSLVPQVDASAVMTDDAPAANLFLLTNAGDGNGDQDNNYSLFAFFNNGIFSAKGVNCTPQDTAKIAAFTPTEGTIIFDTDTQKFKGYVSDTGLAGGGAPNSTPGWVELN